MKVLFAICCLISTFSYSQQYNFYGWEDLQEMPHDPDTIYAISMRKLKLTDIPKKLFQYKNLKALDLTRNQLTALPDELANFLELEYIDLERNKLTIFPIQFCRMSSLMYINLGLNGIEVIPHCIGGIVALEKIYLYDNPVIALPEELEQLKKLKYLDLSGIRFSPEFQKSWLDRLSNVRIDFDAPCECMK